jgi:hypothetical protein
MPTAETLVAMTAKRRRPAANNSVYHLAVLESQMRSVSFPEAASRCADDVGHLKGGPAHRCVRLLECLTAFALDMSIASSGLETACRWRRDRCR